MVLHTDCDTLCYQNMSSGLKNVGATCQCMMDKVFTEHIGRNIEVYVKDMVIRNCDEAALLHNIEETFCTFVHAQMKLNTGKCTFEVEDGEFMGYQITKEGISPNQAKVPEFLDSRTPHSIKGVQEINEILTVFGRFIARSAEKILPLFHTLKGCIDKN